MELTARPQQQCLDRNWIRRSRSRGSTPPPRAPRPAATSAAAARDRASVVHDEQTVQTDGQPAAMIGHFRPPALMQIIADAAATAAQRRAALAAADGGRGGAARGPLRPGRRVHAAPQQGAARAAGHEPLAGARAVAPSPRPPPPRRRRRRPAGRRAAGRRTAGALGGGPLCDARGPAQRRARRAAGAGDERIQRPRVAALERRRATRRA